MGAGTDLLPFLLHLEVGSRGSWHAAVCSAVRSKGNETQMKRGKKRFFSLIKGEDGPYTSGLLSLAAFALIPLSLCGTN